MERSMYSLILIDEVVKKIDELAHTKGTSRSGLVNQILADYISFLTPQKQVEEVFASLGREVSGTGGLRARQSSAGMMNIKSVLNYRYNPTIRYSVEISLESGRYTGELKVSSRTQSDALRAKLSVFYEIWSQIEASALRENTGGTPRFSFSGERFVRWLATKAGQELPDTEAMGRAIGGYIILFDKALKLSFASEHGMDIQTYQQITQLYQEYLVASEISL